MAEDKDKDLEQEVKEALKEGEKAKGVVAAGKNAVTKTALERKHGKGSKN